MVYQSDPIVVTRRRLEDYSRGTDPSIQPIPAEACNINVCVSSRSASWKTSSRDGPESNSTAERSDPGP